MENVTINGNVTVNISTSDAPASTDEINIPENTTLGELLKLLNLGERPHEIPTPKKLRENAGKPIAFYPVSGSAPAQNVECTVYSNGFAVYDNGSGRTVLWLPDCTSFTYIFAKPKASEEGMMPYKEEIPDEMLESLSWFTAVTLIGDHRVENNLMNRKSGRSMSVNYDAYDYDDKHYADDDEKDPYRGAFFWTDGRFGENPLDALIREERNREMQALCTISGQGLSAGNVWDGRLSFEEKFVPVADAGSLSFRKAIDIVEPYTEIPTPIGLVDTFTPARFGRLTALRFIAQPQMNPVIVTEIIEPADRNEMTFNRDYVQSETTFEFQTVYTFTNYEVIIDEGRMSRLDINTEQFARIDSLEVMRSGKL